MISLQMKGYISPLSSPWGRASGLAIFSVLALLSIYYETVGSLVRIWYRSETYAHCFLIFPISGYLIWRRRFKLSELAPVGDLRPLLILPVLGLLWLLANLTGIIVLQQYAMVAMIPVLLWAVLGWEAVSEIAFPLGFLLFSVPFGEVLVPKLINFTADFAVGMLRLTGIPVYRDGTYFSIPSGDWSVVEACSGLRYLIASITLGCLFAYINYVSWQRRLLFIVLATIVPVIANGLRAYMIVMIGHFSGMTLAVGVDHLIYGWVFFGLVMALLFWLGAKWAEEPQPVAQVPHPAALDLFPRSEGKVMAIAAAALLTTAIWPLRVAYINTIAEENSLAVVELPPVAPASPWRASEPTADWRPGYVGAIAQQTAFYTDGRNSIVVFLEYYRGQKQGHELVNSQNLLVAQDPPSRWKVPSEAPTVISLAGQPTEVLQATVKSPQQEFLAWRWYWVDGGYTSSDMAAKALEAETKLLGDLTHEAGIIVAVEVTQDQASARAALQSFVDTMLPSIEQSLKGASGDAAP
ncbi:MAG: exosortase A [Candidatus Methylumidiphilus sp.]